MNRTEHLFTITTEECAEVSQRVSKILRFGIHEIQPGKDRNNVERFLDEYADLQAVIEMLEADGVLKVPDLTERKEKKKVKVEKFLEYSRGEGTLI